MYEFIPEELRQEKSWVNVWRNSKIPMQTTVKKGASSVLPDTWGEFSDAVENVETGVYDGIGYVFHDTGLIGIDIDAGRDEDGFLSSLSVDIMRHCRSYTEWSRSGRGVHILLRGQIPFKGKNNGAGVEIYKSSRYFIMTGRKLIYDKIIDNQEALEYIVATYFPDIPNEGDEEISPRIYNPRYFKPEGGKIAISPEYPVILPGMRNTSLASLAGQLHAQGYTPEEIYDELIRCNEMACKPPLDRSEIQQIVNSIKKYRR